MKNLYERAEQYMIKMFAAKPTNILHLQRTAFWAKDLRPDIDETFLIAALTHDIERAGRTSQKEPSDFIDPEFLRNHQERGAQIMGDFLRREGANQKMVERVKNLIRFHEVGGKIDQDFLKDVDSLSFFENNVEYFISKKETVGKEAVKKKFDWMFERISSPQIKNLTRPYYLDAIAKLG